MGDWERGSSRNQRQQQHRQDGGFYHHGGRGSGGRPSRYSSKQGRPPSSASWKPTVPSWEKEFCYHVGSVPWRKLCESKTLLPFYRSVAQWDDMACREAFHNAKARYWAEIHGLPCDIPLPDPDMYIDEIDWNAKIDPQLLLDLDRKTSPPPSNEDSKSSYLTSGWDAFFVPDEGIPHNGWVVEDEDPVATSGWGGWGDVDRKKDATGNIGWDCNEGWGDEVPDDNSWRDNNNSWGQWGWRNEDRSWGQWEDSKKDVGFYHSDPRNSRKRDGNGGGWYGPRERHKDVDSYKLSGNSFRNCRGRRRFSHANT